MKTAVCVLLLVACKHGDEDYKREHEQEVKQQAEAKAAYEKEMAPYREIEKRYEASVRAIAKAHPAGMVVAGIEKAKGRPIAPILATKTYPDGEVSPIGELWCQGRCDQTAWLAKDPAAAGVLVIADLVIEDWGKWVEEGGAIGRDKELGKAYLQKYDVRAVLMPEAITVATWKRYAMIPGISNHERMPLRSEELDADIAAIAAGQAPVAEGKPPKTTLGTGMP